MFDQIRHAIRGFRKSPGFTSVAVLALALGIGLNASIFSVVNSVLMKPLAYPDSERLVRVWETTPRFRDGGVSFPNLADWRRQNHSFEDLGGYRDAVLNLQGGGDPERLRGALAESEVFRALEVQPLLGRVFSREEDEPGRQNVALISERLWKRRFASERAILGKSVTLDGEAHVIVGVMREDFRFPDALVDVWAPLRLSDADRASRSTHLLRGVGRLKPGASIDSALTDMNTTAQQIERQYRDQTGRGVWVASLQESVTGSVKPALKVLLGAVSIVLLIACANVANLLLARAAGRTQELAVRAALGARRGQLIRQMLVESLVLSIAGGGIGLLLAMWTLGGLVRLAGTALPRAAEVGIDVTVFAYLLLVSIVTGALFGIVPALRASRVDPQDGLRASGGKGNLAGHKDRLRQVLVAGEIGLAFCLLIGAGLLLRALLNLENTNTGMAVENVMTFRVTLPEKQVAGAKRVAFYDRALDELRALPGVRAAGLNIYLPMQSGGFSSEFQIAGQQVPAGQQAQAEIRAASPGYFAALGIPLLRGRMFGAPGDDQYVMINDALAKRYLRNEDPIGKRIDLGQGQFITIAGVVGDVRNMDLAELPRPEITFLYSAALVDSNTASVSFVVSSQVAADATAKSIRDVFRRLDSSLPIYDVQSMQRVIDNSSTGRRFILILLGSFALVALVLAVAGIYGVMSYVVTLRTREFGLRLALGASHAKLLGEVLWQGLALALAGLSAGAVASFGMTRLLSGMLYGVTPLDPVTYVIVGGILVASAMLACYIPAQRASRVDPMIALRHD